MGLNSAAATALTTVGIAALLAALAAWIVWQVARVQRLRLDHRARLQERFLDRLEGEEALQRFLESPGGRRFFDSIERADALAAILRATGRGVFAIFLGVGLLFVREFYPRFESAHVFGILLLAGGVGFVVSAAVSRRLAAKLGLSETPSEET